MYPYRCGSKGTVFGLDDHKYIACKDSDFFLTHHVQTEASAHIASYAISSGTLVPGETDNVKN